MEKAKTFPKFTVTCDLARNNHKINSFCEQNDKIKPLEHLLIIIFKMYITAKICGEHCQND